MIIRNLEDVTREIRQLKDELDRFRSLNLDLNGRKVVNAGRSTSDTDYITRIEVLELLKTTDVVDKIQPGFLQVDFTVTTPEIGEDIAPRPVPFLPLNERAIPILAGARLRTAPTTGSFTLRWNHFSKFNDNEVDLFDGELLTVLQDENYGTITKFYPNRNIATQDYFTLDVVEVNEGAGLYTFLALMVK